MDRYRLQDSEIDTLIEGGSRVDLGAGAPRPTDRGFSLGIPGLAGFGIEPEMFAEGSFGRESQRDGFTVSQSGGSGKFGATVVSPDGHRFTAGVPLNHLSGEVEFGDELQAQGAPENIKFGTNGIERGPIEGRYESPGGFSASGSYDPRTGEGGFYLKNVSKFEDGGVAGGIGPYLDQLDEPRRFANGGRISMEPDPYSGDLFGSAPASTRSYGQSLLPGVGLINSSQVSTAADPEVFQDDLRGLDGGDGGGGGTYGGGGYDGGLGGTYGGGGYDGGLGGTYGGGGGGGGLGGTYGGGGGGGGGLGGFTDPDPAEDTGFPGVGPSDMSSVLGYIGNVVSAMSPVGMASLGIQAITGKSPFGWLRSAVQDLFGAESNVGNTSPTHNVGMGISGYGSDDTGPGADNDAAGPGVGGDGSGSDDTGPGGGDNGGDDGGPGEGDDGGPEGLAEGGVAGLSAGREFKDAGTFPDFMAARLGSMDRRDDAVARKLLGGNASSQVLGQVSRILNSSSDPIKTFADGGSVRSQRLPPDRPPRLGGVPEVSPNPNLIRMADNEFIHTVDPHITNPIARMELLRRTANPGVYEGEEFFENNEPTSISDFLTVRPVLDVDDVSLRPLRTAGKGSIDELRARFEPRLRGAMFDTPRSPDGYFTGILLNQVAAPFVEKYRRDPATGAIPSEVDIASRSKTLQHELIHAGLRHLRTTAYDSNFPPYVSLKGKESALGRILQPNPDKRPRASNDHSAYINILDAASAIKSGVLDPTDEKQLDTWGSQNRNSVSAMQAAIELSRDRSSEEDKGLKIPEKYQVEGRSLAVAEELKKAEEELMEQIKPVLKRDGFSQAHIEAAFGPEEETFYRRLLRAVPDFFGGRN